jgi:hypothetical protein
MPADIDNVEPGEATWTPLQPDLMAHCGGLPSLLAALGESFTFLPPQPMRLAAEPIDGAKPTSIPVYAVVGHWKPDRLAALISESQGSEPQALPMASLPERLPQEVLLLVGQADLFPYRVEYRRLETPDTASDNSSPIPYQLSANPIVVLELSDVAFDVPIAAGQFDYSPGNADWIDQTAGILERLRHRRRTEVAVHAGGDGPK